MGPVAGKGVRAAARALDGIIELCLAVAVLVAAGDRNRPWTSLFLVWVAMVAYETVATVRFGGTVGKRTLGIRVVELDRHGRPSWRGALRRSAVTTLVVLLVPFGIVFALGGLAVGSAGVTFGALIATVLLGGAFGLSVFGDPLGRGMADRSGSTMVVPERYGSLVSTHDLPGFADGVRPPRMTPLGRVADADVRVRARMRRLDDAAVLSAGIGLLALAASVPIAGQDTSATTQLLVVVGTSLAWVVAFIVSETRLVARTGATRGHELAGLRIVDRSTGAKPSTGRSLARATVLGLTMYVPLLWPLLASSLLMMRYGDAGRGLHDLAGGTLVVSDGSLRPEEQRQRSMRMRLGRAG